MLPYAVITITGMSASNSFDGAQHAEAVAFRQAQIRQDERRLVLLQHAHGLGLIARLEHGVALPLERMPQHRAQRVLVFDDENLGGGGHSDGSF